MHQAEMVPIDFQKMGNLEYDVTQFQPILFYAESMHDLQQKMAEFLLSWNDASGVVN